MLDVKVPFELRFQPLTVSLRLEQSEYRAPEIHKRNGCCGWGKASLHSHGRYLAIIGPIMVVTEIGNSCHSRIAGAYFGF